VTDITTKLIGEVLTHIDVDSAEDRITLTTQSGKQFLIHHEQDCCESVSITRCGSAYVGEGIKVQDAREIIESNVPASESATRTIFVINENSYSKIWIEWLGESNGYYSESVSFVEVDSPPPPN